MKKPESLLEVERLEKEGKVKEMIPKWEKEYKEYSEKVKELRSQWRNLYEKLIKMPESIDYDKKSKEYGKMLEKKGVQILYGPPENKTEFQKLMDEFYKKNAPATVKKLKEEMDKIDKQENKSDHISSNAGSKLHWSRLTPEQRERTLRIDKAVNERLERKRKIEEAFEAKLTKGQMEIREKVIGILSPLAPQIVGCTITGEETEKQGESDKILYENANKGLLGLLKEVGGNPEKIREVLSESDGIGGFQDSALGLFDQLYKDCMKDKIIKEFESKLTKKQMKIRKKVIDILNPLAPSIIHAVTEEEVKKKSQTDRIRYPNAEKRLMGLLKEVGGNPEKIREVLSEQDCIGAFGSPALAMFDELYAECVKRG